MKQSFNLMGHAYYLQAENIPASSHILMPACPSNPVEQGPQKQNREQLAPAEQNITLQQPALLRRSPAAPLFAIALHVLLFLVFLLFIQSPAKTEITYLEISLKHFSNSPSNNLQAESSSLEDPAPAQAAQADTARRKPETGKSSPVLQRESAPSNLPQPSLQSGHNDTPASNQGSAQTSTQGTGLASNQPAPLQGNPTPPYPELARKRGQEGTVLLDVEVDPFGAPASVTLRNSSGYALLDESALKTIRKWRFSPAQANGKTSFGKLILPVEFRLKDSLK